MRTYIIILLALLSLNMEGKACVPTSHHKQTNSHSKDKVDTLSTFPTVSIDTTHFMRDTNEIKIDSLTRCITRYQKRDSIFSNVLMARMLYKYPLYERYDSARIAYSLQLIDSLRIQQRFDKLSELMYPILTQYGKYNMELNEILTKLISYAEFGLLTKKVVNEYIDNSAYRKKCNNSIRQIPYLEKIIARIYSLFDSPQGVSVEALEDIQVDL